MKAHLQPVAGSCRVVLLWAAALPVPEINLQRTEGSGGLMKDAFTCGEGSSMLQQHRCM